MSIDEIIEYNYQRSDPYFLSSEQIDLLLLCIDKSEIIELANPRLKKIKMSYQQIATIMVSPNEVKRKIKIFPENSGLTEANFDHVFHLGVIGVVYETLKDSETDKLERKFKRFTNRHE